MNHEDCHRIFHQKRDLRCNTYKRSKFRVSVSLEVITLALPIVTMFNFEPRNGMYFEHIVQSHCNTSLFSVHS